MATLSIEEVARLALNAGWKGEDAAVATAIAMAESNGNTRARGDVGLQTARWGPSIGLWQIRSLNAQKGTGGERDELANYNPATNARHAYQISNGGSTWRPWSVWLSGSYRRYLARARIAVGAPASSVPGGDDAGGGALMPNPFSKLFGGGLWLRLGTFVLGGLLILFALYRLTGIGGIAVSGIKTAVKARTGVSL